MFTETAVTGHAELLPLRPPPLPVLVPFTDSVTRNVRLRSPGE